MDETIEVFCYCNQTNPEVKLLGIAITFEAQEWFCAYSIDAICQEFSFHSNVILYILFYQQFFVK